MIRVAAADIKGLATYLQRTPEVAQEAAKLAVSDTADWGKNMAARMFTSTVNLPADALAARRFRVSQRPTSARPEAIISADNNPLGLSRFVVGAKKPGAPHPRTQVLVGGSVKQWSAPGGDNYAFLIPTPNGAAGVGLAIRTKGALRNSKAARQIGRNLYLLSGPSVNQMFAQLMPAIVPRVEAKLQAEFQRQYSRLIRG